MLHPRYIKVLQVLSSSNTSGNLSACGSWNLSCWHSGSSAGACFLLCTHQTARGGVPLVGASLVCVLRIWLVLTFAGTTDKQRSPGTAAVFFTFGKAEQKPGFIESGRFLIIVIIYLVFTDKSSNLFCTRCWTHKPFQETATASKCFSEERGHWWAQQMIC